MPASSSGEKKIWIEGFFVDGGQMGLPTEFLNLLDDKTEWKYEQDPLRLYSRVGLFGSKLLELQHVGIKPGMARRDFNK